jgi:putative YhdH/YhfP family quinone oxidoreductase
MNLEYLALVTEEYEPNKYSRAIKTQIIDNIPENHSLIKVEYSSLNYKDALSARGHKGITRKYPHTPGVDACGIIENCSSGLFSEGDKVIVTGNDLGMDTNGGFGQYIVVPDNWIVKLPENLSLYDSMCFGTAGFTAAICVYEFNRNGINPDSGKILVTGATGGVGSMAVGILSKLGYNVVASTGKLTENVYLTKLGASEIINRTELEESSTKPMVSAKWVGVVDNVGGNTLTNVIKSVSIHGCVCILGNVSGDVFSSSVYPFLLRGISLIGIDSASKDLKLRIELWDKLSNDWKFPALNDICKLVKLNELDSEIELILKGGQVGRVVVKLWD